MTTEHFDRRGATYDGDGGHRRIVEILMAGVALRPGMRVLDLATGTGAVALAAAGMVGAGGSVVGVDVSPGMLAEARRKAGEAGLENIAWMEGDAEEMALEEESFDCVLLGSGLIFMRDIPGMLRRCLGWLAPGGAIGFDMPAKPFGMSQWIAEAAAEEGILLAYDRAADTPAKCRLLLSEAGFAEIVVRTETVSDEVVTVEEAMAFLEQRMDHPAWRALREATEETQRRVRSGYLDGLHRRAQEGRVRVTVAQNFVYGRRPQGS